MNILFISHDASRTGAPILLLSLQRWLKENSAITFSTILLRGGELEKEFEALGCVVKWDSLFSNDAEKRYVESKKILISQNTHKFNWAFISFFNFFIEYWETFKGHTSTNFPASNLTSKLGNQQFDIIFGNTIVSTEIMPFLLSKFKIPGIINVHELFSITGRYQGAVTKLSALPQVRFIAGSFITADNLISKHAVPPEKIKVVHEYINAYELIERPFFMPDGAFVVNGSGLVQIRKGVDFFLMSAFRAVQKYPEIKWRFNWIGKIDAETKYYYETDIIKAGLEGIVYLLGEFDDLTNCFENSNVFLLVSREDPFPLVGLAHAALGKPVICFNKGTGISEIVQKGAGFEVEYMNIEEVVDTLYDLAIDPQKYNQISVNARKVASEFDISIKGELIKSIILKTVENV